MGGRSRRPPGHVGGRLALCLWPLFVLGEAPAHLAAQQDTLPSEPPFVAGGVYDKPYLTTLLGRTALGGYAEAHARWQRLDGVTEELGFEARRFKPLHLHAGERFRAHRRRG